MTIIRQNEEADLDFTIVCSRGECPMELMEILAFRGPYKNAPESYCSYDYAFSTLMDILGKSSRYGSNAGRPLVLLLYVTDWRFAPSQTFLALLQFWLLTHHHRFSDIVIYCPTDESDGIPFLLYPTPKAHWRGFRPGDFRRSIVQNLNFGIIPNRAPEDSQRG